MCRRRCCVDVAWPRLPRRRSRQTLRTLCWSICDTCRSIYSSYWCILPLPLGNWSEGTVNVESTFCHSAAVTTARTPTPCPLMKLSRAVRCGTAEGGCPCVGEGESQSQRRCFAPQGGWGHPPLHEQARDAPQFLELRNPTLRVRARVSRHRASPNRALHGQREGPGFPLPEFGKTAGAWGNPNRYSSHIPKFRRPEAAWSACSRILDHTQEG